MPRLCAAPIPRPVGQPRPASIAACLPAKIAFRSRIRLWKYRSKDRPLNLWGYTRKNEAEPRTRPLLSESDPHRDGCRHDHCYGEKSGDVSLLCEEPCRIDLGSLDPAGRVEVLMQCYGRFWSSRPGCGSIPTRRLTARGSIHRARWYWKPMLGSSGSPAKA